MVSGGFRGSWIWRRVGFDEGIDNERSDDVLDCEFFCEWLVFEGAVFVAEV